MTGFDDEEFVAKVVLVGECSVGKSTLALRFVKEKFYERTESTIGAAFLTKTLTVNGEPVKFELWDTAGQERYHSLVPMYSRDAQLALIVYDITKEATFARAKTWLGELRSSASDDLVIALVGNKCDLDGRRRVSAESAHAFAEENDIPVCMETSAKSGHNITLLFTKLAEQLENTEDDADRGNGPTFRLDDYDTNETGSEKEESTCPC
eukprot:TRINITY_DN1186_c1_g1_i1.p1 TRINITY_DN1186_c1_g1~~TRINITY_DN1186_c1_g1_i1.p1  ORF type:complete len:209 (+),score=31.15 TRINITY_DN1186_c1_g1_i1:224-850(+)